MPKLPANKDDFNWTTKYVYSGKFNACDTMNTDEVKMTLWVFSESSCWCDGFTPTEALDFITGEVMVGHEWDEEWEGHHKIIQTFLKKKGVTIPGLIKFFWLRLLKRGVLKPHTAGYKCPHCVEDESEPEAEAAPAGAVGGAAAAAEPERPNLDMVRAQRSAAYAAAVAAVGRVAGTTEDGTPARAALRAAIVENLRREEAAAAAGEPVAYLPPADTLTAGAARVVSFASRAEFFAASSNIKSPAGGEAAPAAAPARRVIKLGKKPRVVPEDE